MSDKKGKACDATTPTANPAQGKLSLPNYVNATEQDNRRKEGLCIKCGAPDDTMKQCKNGYLVKCLSANKGAESAKKKEEPRKESGKVALEEAEEMESEGLGNE